MQDCIAGIQQRQLLATAARNSHPETSGPWHPAFRLDDAEMIPRSIDARLSSKGQTGLHVVAPGREDDRPGPGRGQDRTMGAFCSMGIDGILSTACKRRGIAYQPPQMHASHALGGRTLLVWHVEGCILGPWSRAFGPMMVMSTAGHPPEKSMQA